MFAAVSSPAPTVSVSLVSLAVCAIRDVAVSNLFQAPPRDDKQLTAVRGQGDVACRSIEEPESELVLQFTDQHAQPGGGDEERFRGAGEVVVLRDEKKRPQLSRGKIDH